MDKSPKLLPDNAWNKLLKDWLKNDISDPHIISRLIKSVVYYLLFPWNWLFKNSK